MGDIISVKDLNLWYGNNQALYDIDLGIPEKSITAFIGPSGCAPEELPASTTAFTPGRDKVNSKSFQPG